MNPAWFSFSNQAGECSEHAVVSRWTSTTVITNRRTVSRNWDWTRDAELNSCCSLQPCRTPKATELQGTRTIMIQLLPRLHPLAHQHQTSALCACMLHAEANHCAETWDTSLQSVFSNMSTELRTRFFFWNFFKCGDLRGLSVSLSTELHYFSEIFTCGDLRCLSVSLSLSVLGRLQRTKNLCVVSEWVSGGNKSSARASLSAPPTLLNWNHFSSMHYDFFVAISIGCHTYHSCIQGCTNTLKLGHVHAPHASAGISEDDWKSLPHLPNP